MISELVIAFLLIFATAADDGNLPEGETSITLADVSIKLPTNISDEKVRELVDMAKRLEERYNDKLRELETMKDRRMQGIRNRVKRRRISCLLAKLKRDIAAFGRRLSAIVSTVTTDMPTVRDLVTFFNDISEIPNKISFSINIIIPESGEKNITDSSASSSHRYPSASSSPWANSDTHSFDSSSSSSHSYPSASSSPWANSDTHSFDSSSSGSHRYPSDSSSSSSHSHPTDSSSSWSSSDTHSFDSSSSGSHRYPSDSSSSSSDTHSFDWSSSGSSL